MSDKIAKEQGIITEVISDARDALEWLAELEKVEERMDKLSPARFPVETNTSRNKGSFVEVSLTATFDEADPKATAIMDNHEWDKCSFSQDGSVWCLYVKRRYSYA